jgi:hypothetical protein
MPLIQFPDVPRVPGVPPLPRSVNAPPLVRAVLGAVQGAVWRIFETQSQWGIFDSKGKALGDPSKLSAVPAGLLQSIGLGATVSTGAVQYVKETKISDFPLEKGSFADYNKVEMAASPVVTLCFSGNVQERKAFLNAIDAACKSTNLYSLVTPEVTYIEHAIERYDYERRNGNGAYLLIVSIGLKEIRQVSAKYVTTAVKSTKDATATPSTDAGKVQAKTPDVSTLKSIADKLPGLANQAQSYIQGLFK